jgi:hypothetical protein
VLLLLQQILNNLSEQHTSIYFDKLSQNNNKAAVR